MVNAYTYPIYLSQNMVDINICRYIQYIHLSHITLFMLNGLGFPISEEHGLLLRRHRGGAVRGHLRPRAAGGAEDLSGAAERRKPPDWKI